MRSRSAVAVQSRRAAEEDAVPLPQPETRSEQHTRRGAEASMQPGQQVALDAWQQRAQHVADLAAELALPAASSTWPSRRGQPRRPGSCRGGSSPKDRLQLAQGGVLVGADVLGQQRVRHAASLAAHAQHPAPLAAQPTVVPGVVSEDATTAGDRADHHRPATNLVGVVVGCRGGDSERGSGVTRWGSPFRSRTAGFSGGPDTYTAARTKAGFDPRWAPSSLAALTAGGAGEDAATVPVYGVGGLERRRWSPVRQGAAEVAGRGALQMVSSASMEVPSR